MMEDESLRWTLPCVDAQRMKTLALLLGDPNPIHLSDQAARDVGFPAGPVNQGPSTIALIYNLFEERSPSRRVTRLRVRLMGNVIAGQVVEVAATPVADERDGPDTGAYAVTVDADGVRVVEGRAETSERGDVR